MSYPFNELRVRKFPYDKKLRLVQLAENEHKSLQQFLYEQLAWISDHPERVK